MSKQLHRSCGTSPPHSGPSATRVLPFRITLQNMASAPRRERSNLSSSGSELLPRNSYKHSITTRSCESSLRPASVTHAPRSPSVDKIEPSPLCVPPFNSAPLCSYSFPCSPLPIYLSVVSVSSSAGRALLPPLPFTPELAPFHSLLLRLVQYLPV